MPRAKAPRWKLFLLRRLLHDKRIYNICAALRGPDHYGCSDDGFNSEFSQLKSATTAVIRYALGLRQRGPLMAHDDGFSQYDFRRNLRSRVPVGTLDADATRRFRWQAEHVISHTESAFTALGLDWNIVNRRDMSGDAGDL